ncbi:uridine diphosphate glucose pyrophosphatase NUDT14 isoform X2 [Psammomys obesus]|uniref:uridine diphosphate glucose pyrophosphatase NUDT14 isoform X2 n=1 Tax=Psammomys obesus TaxID=48139 RepID=UPI002452873C|nr:uridine diphosphate glucose pyrophosphatase NUDT14 isoform X2 [Psammomys obesus]
MERVEGVSVGFCAHSPYLRPLTLHYRQDGIQKSWDFMKTHDSVTILMFNSSQRSLVLVKQFRPAVYAGEVERHFPGSLAAVDQDQPKQLEPALPGSVGVMVELCAGIVDQPGLSLEEVACKEAWEECGYHLVPTDLRRIATYMLPTRAFLKWKATPCLRVPVTPTNTNNDKAAYLQPRRTESLAPLSWHTPHGQGPPASIPEDLTCVPSCGWTMLDPEC